MNKTLKKILIVSALILICVLIVPHVVNAQTGLAAQTLVKLTQGTIVGEVANNVIQNAVNYVAYMALVSVSNFVSITGSFLSLSMKLTLNIKNIYEAGKGIESIWITVRDLSSIFIIFVLLYESIKMILGLKGQGFNKTIVKIFIAGMLINFSLFFFKILVDTSNLISLQFYNAITPNTSENLNLSSSFNDGGLSNIYMQSLQVWTIFNKANISATGAALSITTTVVAGFVMMIMAGLSFLGAAVAFTIRTGILLFLMVLSPLYFAGMIFPEIEKRISHKMLGLFTSQLIFMPVYLFLTYISLKIISDSGYVNYFDKIQGDQSFGLLLVLVVRFTIAFIFINAPLVVALELGAWGMKWVPDLKSIGGGLRKFGGNITGAIGRNSIGWAGEKAGKAFDNMAAEAQKSESGKRASTVLRKLGISQAVRGGLSSIEEGKYGSKQSRADVEKEDKARSREIVGVQRKNEQLAKINNAIGPDRTTDLNQSELAELSKTVGGVDAKELEKFNFDKILNKPIVAASIPAAKFEALLKSDSLDLSQQEKLKEARKEGFRKIFTDHKADYLLQKFLGNKDAAIAKLPVDLLKEREIAIRLSAETLKKIIDESGVSQEDRDEIRRHIESLYNATSGSGLSVPRNLEKAYNYLTNGQGSYFF